MVEKEENDNKPKNKYNKCFQNVIIVSLSF